MFENCHGKHDDDFGKVVTALPVTQALEYSIPVAITS
jgi:hypothetical protein